MNKTFKGILTNGDQLRIRLTTNQGLVGYKIVKMQAIPSIPGSTVDTEIVLQAFSTKRSSVPTAAGDAKLNFDDPTLLAAAYYQDNVSASNASSFDVIIDNKIVNQDMFITYSDQTGAASTQCNFYVELEQVTLDLSEATVATLKDMRGRE
jgi:hypothetical protein